jgi:type II secretory pathway pseudopilin PulG
MSPRVSVRIRSSEGFTLIDMIFAMALIGILSAMAVPTVFRSKLAANETSVIGTMRTLHSGQLTYSLTCGYGLFATTFTALGDPTGDGFLPTDLTASPTPMKSGYSYGLVPGPSGVSGLSDCNGVAISTEYYVTASPTVIGSTGNRAFASNQATTIWQDAAGVPPVEPFTPGGTVSSIE